MTIIGSKTIDLGEIITTSARITANPNNFPRRITLLGRFGLRIMIKSGNVISTATAVEEYIVIATTSGRGLMNSPKIPVVISKGRKAHTVVIVVVQIGTIKSRQTKIPVW